MNGIVAKKKDETKHRRETAIQDKNFDYIRNLCVCETRPEHFDRALADGKVSTNVYLRRIRNFALDMNWLPWPILPKRQWPQMRYKEKRAITFEEHQRIIAAEVNLERKVLCQLCWNLGARRPM
jgi:hypothetical protein